MTDRRVTNAVILARGRGTRMQRPDPSVNLDAQQAETAAKGMKALIPVGRPFLDYVLSGLADVGCTDVCLVVAPGPNDLRARYTEELCPSRLHMHFAVQVEPRGTADALLAARDFAGDELFLMINSDNFYPAEVLRKLCASGGPALAAFERETLIRESNISRERILDYAVLWIGAGGWLERIVEKPSAEVVASLGTEVFVSMNAWVFGPEIFPACERVAASPRGELELQTAVQNAIERKDLRIRALKVRAGVLDLSTRADIAAVAGRLRDVSIAL